MSHLASSFGSVPSLFIGLELHCGPTAEAHNCPIIFPNAEFAGKLTFQLAKRQSHLVHLSDYK